MLCSNLRILCSMYLIVCMKYAQITTAILGHRQISYGIVFCITRLVKSHEIFQRSTAKISPQLTYSVNILLVIQWPMRLSSEIKLPTAVKKRILFPLPTRLACHKVFENRTFGLMWHTGSCQPFSQKEDGWHNYQRPPSSYTTKLKLKIFEILTGQELKSGKYCQALQSLLESQNCPKSQ